MSRVSAAERALLDALEIAKDGGHFLDDPTTRLRCRPEASARQPLLSWFDWAILLSPSVRPSETGSALESERLRAKRVPVRRPPACSQRSVYAHIGRNGPKHA